MGAFGDELAADEIFGRRVNCLYGSNGAFAQMERGKFSRRRIAASKACG